MFLTALAHAAIAVGVQYALAYFGGLSAIAAGIMPVAFYLGREITQHEYKLGIQRGWQWGDKLPVSPFEGAYRGWSMDSALDVVLPVAACAGVAYWLL